MKHITSFLLLCCCSFSVFAQLPPRPAVNPALAPFYHGVASGDPLSDRVIIWTRVTPTGTGSVSVSWQVATDSVFAHVVNSGTVTTDSSVDYTVKVDVTGLSANSWYYYKFKTGTAFSITARTKTLPAGNVDSIRLAVMSCSDFQSGFFNVYNDVSRRNDLSAVVHLGDYYYEYQSGGSGSTSDTSRFHPYNHDAYTLGDYRLWESQYKLDQDSRAMLQQYPLIMVWDDHEVCNNSWYSSAENHNSATQGNFFTRKNAAKKAFFEWNPIRPIATGNDSIIHRNFKFGNLFNLIMLDTRLEGRDSSLAALISSTNAYMNDTGRHMLGTTQLNWFKANLSDTSARWKIVGSQIMVSALVLNVFGSVQVLNGDQWDGYPAERKRVFDHISRNDIRDVVFLSGDIHSSWASDLVSSDSTYVASTGAGSVATEFIGSAVTSPSFLPVTPSAITSADPYFKYIEATKRGYLLFDINKTRVQGDFIHASTVASRTYSMTDDAQWVNVHNERHLRTGAGVLGSTNGHNPPLVSPFPIVSAVPDVNNVVMFACYPNPATNEINVQFYLAQSGKLTATLTDVRGRVVYTCNTAVLASGVNNYTFNINNLDAGTYILTLGNEQGSFSKRLIKQ